MSDKSSHGVFFLDLLLFVDITNHFLWSDYTIAKHRLQVGILKIKKFLSLLCTNESCDFCETLRQLMICPSTSLFHTFFKIYAYYFSLHYIADEKGFFRTILQRKIFFTLCIKTPIVFCTIVV